MNWSKNNRSWSFDIGRMLMGQMKKAFIVFVVLIVGQTGFAQQEPELNDSTKKPM